MSLSWVSFEQAWEKILQKLTLNLIYLLVWLLDSCFNVLVRRFFDQNGVKVEKMKVTVVFWVAESFQQKFLLQNVVSHVDFHVACMKTAWINFWKLHFDPQVSPCSTMAQLHSMFLQLGPKIFAFESLFAFSFALEPWKFLKVFV